MSKSDKIRIKAEDIKVSTGHQPHITGTGKHDNRPKRERTRSNVNKKAIKDSQDDAA